MSKMRRLSWSDGGTVTPGRQLTYITGKGDSFCEASVTVTEVVMAGCMVRIDEILTQGNKTTLQVGGIVSAGWGELEIYVS